VFDQFFIYGTAVFSKPENNNPEAVTSDRKRSITLILARYPVEAR
jgi:hypothetical protein